MGVSDHTGVPVHLAGVRSFDPADYDMPSGREEAWRFTPKNRFKPLFEDAAGQAVLAMSADAPAGVSVTRISAAQARERSAAAPIDRVAALAAAHAPEAVLVEIPAEADLDRPVVLSLTGEASDKVAWGLVLIEAGANARATVVLQHTGSALLGEFVSLQLGDGASVDFVSVQSWADDAVHGGHIAATVGRDARLRSVVATLNADAVRLVHSVDYAGPGGDAELLGAFFADAGQHSEHRILVDHAQPHCRSNVVYKGALAGQAAHSVWIGDVIIRAEAVGTDTYELNRNLLLTQGARADSVPNLEIETGDVVGAGHASATGRFDDDQLFYLQARGIPEPVARRLVVRGFFADVVRRIESAEIRDQVLAAIDAELAALDDSDQARVTGSYAAIFDQAEE